MDGVGATGRARAHASINMIAHGKDWKPCRFGSTCSITAAFTRAYVAARVSAEYIRCPTETP